MQTSSLLAIGPRDDLDSMASGAPSYAAAASAINPGDNVLVSECWF